MPGATAIVTRVRRELRRRGSPAIARSTQRFFKEPVEAYGWRTAAVRQLARRLRGEILAAGNGRLLFAVAEKFFSGPTVEENTLGVVLLERSVRGFGDAEFRRLERWLGWVRNWAACDALTGTLLGPLLAADAGRVRRVFVWARSRNRWRRRAAATALIPGSRRGLHARGIFRVADRLLADEDDMVQKGVGWLLKESTKKMRPQARAPAGAALCLREAARRRPQADSHLEEFGTLNWLRCGITCERVVFLKALPKRRTYEAASACDSSCSR